MSRDTVAKKIVALDGYENMTQREIASAIGVCQSTVHKTIKQKNIPHGKHSHERAIYAREVDDLVERGYTDKEIAQLTNTSLGRVRYTRLHILGHPPKYYYSQSRSDRDSDTKIDLAIQWQKERKNELEQRKSLVTEPKIQPGDIIDVDIDDGTVDGTVDIYPVKLREVSGRHYIFQSRSGWKYALTAVQLNEVLETQTPRKEWHR